MFKSKWGKKKSKKKNIRIKESILPEGERNIEIKRQIDQNQYRLNQIFGNTSDLQVQRVGIGHLEGILCFLTTMADSKVITDQILHSLSVSPLHQRAISNEKEWDNFARDVFSGSRYQFFQFEHDIVWNILNGYAVIFLNGMSKALGIQINSTEHRSIVEPTTQTIVRGPKDGFTENLNTNLSLIRRRIKNPSLRFESYIIGKETGTSVCIAYMDGIINSGILKEVRTRMSEIETNAIFESSNVEEFIVDKTLTPFPLLYNTERPDTISSHLISGKVAIFVDGTPFVLTVPAIFSDFLSMTEDYYQPFIMGSFIRVIRYLSFMLALLLPSLFVSIITYHHEMIPTTLLISIISQREGIPFPAVFEALLMEITFEVLREAGVRMPRAVGGTISIVGGLVIGQAAVEAGIVSNVMVIVVALTAIASFVSPVYDFSIAARLLRFWYIILASVFGLFGVLLGAIIMVGHLCSLRSFGVPYLAPIAPFILEDQKDIFIRSPIWSMKKRPQLLKTESELKQPDSESPTPPPIMGDEEK